MVVGRGSRLNKGKNYVSIHNGYFCVVGFGMIFLPHVSISQNFYDRNIVVFSSKIFIFILKYSQDVSFYINKIKIFAGILTEQIILLDCNRTRNFKLVIVYFETKYFSNFFTSGKHFD